MHIEIFSKSQWGVLTPKLPLATPLIWIKIEVTFKSSSCRYFKNCIRKCESSSIPTSAKLRWGVETLPPGSSFDQRKGVRQDEVGVQPPNTPGNSNTGPTATMTCNGQLIRWSSRPNFVMQRVKRFRKFNFVSWKLTLKDWQTQQCNKKHLW